MSRKPKYDYFHAFEKQAHLAIAEADLLIKVVEGFTTADAVHEFMPAAHQLEHEGDEINHETFTAIAIDFITPIDRDDIMNVSQALDDVIDSIEDVITQFYMMDIHFMHKDAIDMVRILKKNCESLLEATTAFSNFKKSSAFKKAIVDVNTYEEEADQLYVKLIRNLHTIDRENPMRVLVWSRIFSKMEVSNDACEHVADLMSSILLKNS